RVPPSQLIPVRDPHRLSMDRSFFDVPARPYPNGPVEGRLSGLWQVAGYPLGRNNITSSLSSFRKPVKNGRGLTAMSNRFSPIVWAAGQAGLPARRRARRTAPGGEQADSANWWRSCSTGDPGQALLTRSYRSESSAAPPPGGRSYPPVATGNAALPRGAGPGSSSCRIVATAFAPIRPRVALKNFPVRITA